MEVQNFCGLGERGMHRENVEDLESRESVLNHTLVVDTCHHTFVRATEGSVLAGTTVAHCQLG